MHPGVQSFIPAWVEIFMSREERIEKMYREKQERIARHTALKLAVEVVTASEQSRLSSPDKNAGKVVEVAERFYDWLRGERDG